MELLKLLIADDEENIRNGLKCILDWEKCGYKFCGEASNGKDTVNQIIDLKPDLVILDIKMPGMTGIEVITQIKDYFGKHNIPMPSFLILSGYSDFEYAQKTVNLGAKAYLLKPVDEDELQEKILQIAAEINEKKVLAQAYKDTEKLSLNDKLLKIVQNQKITPEEYKELPFFEDSENNNYQVVIFYLDYCSNYDSEDFERSCQNYFSFFKYVSLPNENKIIIFFKAKNEQAIKNCLERAAKLSPQMTFITLGNNYTGIDGLVKSYKEALDYEKYLFFLSKVPFISSDKINFSETSVDKTRTDEIIDSLVFTIETYDKNKLKEIEEQIRNDFFGLNTKQEEIKKQLIYLCVELRNRLSAKYPEREISDGETFDVVQKILEMKSFAEAFTYFNNLMNNFIENFNFNTADSVIVKVIAYVKSNYSSDLKLEILGDMFNCNSAYLGKKFRKYTGVQFNTYLDNLRIEEAKNKIMNTDLKIYQISKLVGYSNTDYFFMKFKKNTGYTPKEYKKMLEENNGGEN